MKNVFYTLQVISSGHLFGSFDEGMILKIFEKDSPLNQWAQETNSWVSLDIQEVEFLRLYCGKGVLNNAHNFLPSELQVVEISFDESYPYNAHCKKIEVQLCLSSDKESLSLSDEIKILVGRS